MTATLAAWCSAWKPQDTRTVAEWAAEHVTITGSARSRKFDPSASPWLAEPLEYFADNRVREQVLVMPTGAGKTTIFDVCIPHAIAEDPGSILLAMQTDPDAREHMDDRLMPILRACNPVEALMAGLDRHSIRKEAIIFPHMSVYCGGANKTNFQRKSVRYVFVDEAWLVKHGLIEEARARTHNRWNRRIVIVSQGGNETITIGAERRDTELHEAWARTDRREFSMVCPECSAVTPWKWKHLTYERGEGEIDERAVQQSAHYVCPHCQTAFEDKPEVRRALSSSSVYVATNPNALPGHHGWHAPAMAMFHEAWGDLALGWVRAQEAKKSGDNEPLKIFITKRLAEFWKEDEDAPEVLLGASGYTVGDYTDGTLIDGELFRFMAIDRQRDYFFAGIRAFRADGSSRLLYYGRPTTIEACRALQLQYKVIDDFTAEDASHRPTDVYDDAAKFGALKKVQGQTMWVGWVPMFGDQVTGFDHIPARGGRAIKKLFSPFKKAMASDGTIVRYIRWASTPVKDILFSKLAGRGPAFEVPDDIGEEYHSQIRAEVKREVVSQRTKAISEVYVKTRRRNDACDVEGMMLTFAIIKGVAVPEVAPKQDAEEVAEPVST